MRNRAWFALILMALMLLVPLLAHAQNVDAWHDPSPHGVRSVAVEPNVQLEVLDWGGSGRPIILLNGLGGTAHGFDDFAPKLTRMGHVYGITRRGYGSSSSPSVGYDADRLGDDVLAVMTSLNITKPVLVGESIAGEELSSVGSRDPDQVAGLVYLDAAYPYAFDNGKGMTIEELQRFLLNPPPIIATQLQELDWSSFAALQASSVRNFGVTLPEAELRQMYTAMPDGRVGGARPLTNRGSAILAGIKKYTEIPTRILAIFAIPHDVGPWVSSIQDEKTRKSIEALDLATEKQAKAFEEGVPSARVVRLPNASHAIFISNEPDVLREMRAFLASLQ